MGRRPSLTDEQLIEVQRLHLIEGRSINSLAKEFGVNESSLRRKIKPNKAESPNGSNPLKDLAIEKVRADIAVRVVNDRIAELPYPAQNLVFDIAQRLRNISLHLGASAEYGAMTSHKLSLIANEQAERIDPCGDLEQNMENLKSVAALTRTANEAASCGLELLKANKEAVAALNAPAPQEVKKGLTHFYGGRSPKPQSRAI